MFKTNILFLSFAILANICIAQKDLQKAKIMSKKYPKSDVYITKNSIEFYLEYNKPDKTVIAIQKEKTSLISLNNDVQDIFVKSYDENSSYIEYAKFESPVSYDSEITSSNYSSSEIFHNDIKLKIIDLYFKQRGDFASFVTKKRFLDLKYIEPIYLANHKPTEEKTIKLTIENELDYNILELNFEKFNIKKKHSFDQKKNLHIYEYQITNPPFVENSKDIRGQSYHLPHILIIPKSYKSKKHTQEFFKDVNDLYAWYANLVKTLENNPEQLKPLLGEIIEKNDSDIEKIRKIYYWVQHNIRYIAFEDGIAGFKPEEAHTVYNKKYGDCKGVANLTKHLLKLEGFDARLAWIGTNSRAYDYSIPSLIVDNHMICALFHSDTVYYLDGTEKFMPLGHNAERIQNKEVLIEDGDNFIIKKVPMQNSTDNLRTRNTQMIIDGNSMIGKSIMNYSGESKSKIKAYLNIIENNKKADALRDYYESDNLEIKNIKYGHLNNIDSLFSINFDFVSNNSVMKFDDELYIKFENYNDLIHAEIDSSFLFDYNLKYKRDIESRTSIALPEGYSVSFLPDNISCKNSDFIIDVNFKLEGNKITYYKTIKISNGLILNANKDEWNEAVKKLINLYNSNIIFKKS